MYKTRCSYNGNMCFLWVPNPLYFFCSHCFALCNIDGLVQDCSNYIGKAVSCLNPSISSSIKPHYIKTQVTIKETSSASQFYRWIKLILKGWIYFQTFALLIFSQVYWIEYIDVWMQLLVCFTSHNLCIGPFIVLGINGLILIQARMTVNTHWFSRDVLF